MDKSRPRHFLSLNYIIILLFLIYFLCNDTCFLTFTNFTVQIQAVTSVGGGMFSSPVIISYNNNDDTSTQNSSTAIIGLSVSVTVLILLLLIAGTMAVIYIM